jgi:hypothetical protein
MYTAVAAGSIPHCRSHLIPLGVSVFGGDSDSTTNRHTITLRIRKRLPKKRAMLQEGFIQRQEDKECCPYNGILGLWQ